MDALTLDQFAVFLTVVREGSFAAAARRMNRAQSTITYTIQKLEEQSGLVLFDRSAYRPVLTEAGTALLPRAKQILDDVDAYRRHVREITNGLEAVVTVVIDLHAPSDFLPRTLDGFRRAFPSVEIRIHNEPIAAAISALCERVADIGLLVEAMPLPAELERRSYGHVDVVPVAAPTHPLGQIKEQCSPEILRSYTQLVFSSGVDATNDRDDVHCVNCWRLNNLEMKRELILAGVGWGRLPRPTIAQDLAAWRLVELSPERLEGADVVSEFPLVLAYLKSRPLGPAARWLRQQFVTEA